ncbi:nucleophile aminohydrolase [Lentinula edodes]|nr:nucleophile aminohydrolase [Lentinula edodes]
MTRPALTVFPPDGHLFQVEYTLVAVRKGTFSLLCSSAMRGKDVVVLNVEKKSVLQLQDPRTVGKVTMLDDHVCLTADGRVLIDKAWIECRGHRLTVEDPVTVLVLIHMTPSLIYTHQVVFTVPVREFPEKNHKDDLSREESIKLP